MSSGDLHHWTEPQIAILRYLADRHTEWVSGRELVKLMSEMDLLATPRRSTAIVVWGLETRGEVEQQFETEPRPGRRSLSAKGVRITDKGIDTILRMRNLIGGASCIGYGDREGACDNMPNMRMNSSGLWCTECETDRRSQIYDSMAKVSQEFDNQWRDR